MKSYKEKYYLQKYIAIERGIEWLLTFKQWMKIWTDSGHLHERGRKLGQYCMSRPGDKGPYSVDNVKIILHGENSREAHFGKKLSIEHRKKVGKFFAGKPKSIEQRKKMSKARSKWWTSERRLERGRNYSGDGHPMFGRKHSAETKEKIRIAMLGNKNNPHSRSCLFL